MQQGAGCAFSETAKSRPRFLPFETRDNPPHWGLMQLHELQAIYATPFFELISRSRSVYLEHWSGNEVQLCTLLSIKTGGCSEDCGYCAQSARYSTGVKAEKLMPQSDVMEAALRAKENGSTRFCMGAAWKGVRDGDPRFEQVLDTITEVSKLGMEVCVTLGQLTLTEAKKLKNAGVKAYNHNIDTSPEHYPNIVTTHTFQDRLNTIRSAQEAGMDVCCGGIIGMGETELDRLKMLEVLTQSTASCRWKARRWKPRKPWIFSSSCDSLPPPASHFRKPKCG